VIRPSHPYWGFARGPRFYSRAVPLFELWRRLCSLLCDLLPGSPCSGSSLVLDWLHSLRFLEISVVSCYLLIDSWINDYIQLYAVLVDTLALRVECQSARKSKTKNGRLASLASNPLHTVLVLELWTYLLT